MSPKLGRLPARPGSPKLANKSEAIMKSHSFISGCACCPMNRRNFLAAGSTAVLGTLGALATPGWLQAAEPASKTRIRIVYSLHTPKQNRPDWPNKGFDFVPVMEKINAELARRCKGF